VALVFAPLSPEQMNALLQVLVASAAVDMAFGGHTIFNACRLQSSSGTRDMCSMNSQKMSIDSNHLTVTTNHMGIPMRVLNRLKRAGANVTDLARNQFFVQNIRFGDAAWDVLSTFAESSSVDPMVFIAFFPLGEYAHSCLAPSRALEGEILREARSIASHYAPLMTHEFVMGVQPLIPGPLLFPPIGIMIQHPKIALIALVSRIRHPRHPGYPTLTAIRPGSYICTIFYQWRNALHSFPVHK
jgi:hypothetical protein